MCYQSILLLEKCVLQRAYWKKALIGYFIHEQPGQTISNDQKYVIRFQNYIWSTRPHVTLSKGHPAASMMATITNTLIS